MPPQRVTLSAGPLRWASQMDPFAGLLTVPLCLISLVVLQGPGLRCGSARPPGRVLLGERTASGGPGLGFCFFHEEEERGERGRG